MKRSPISRKTALARTGALRSRRKGPNPAEDLVAKAAWKEPTSGKCRCGCSPPLLAMHLERHHIVSADLIKRLGRHDVLWDPRNGLLLHPKHHRWHTDAFRRVPLSSVPDAAIAFAIELLGEGSAMVYLDAQYATGETWAA